MMKLDDVDLQILKTLQKNAKLTTKELADAVHLTPTPVFERQKRLEKKGFIKKYVAILDDHDGCKFWRALQYACVRRFLTDTFVIHMQLMLAMEQQPKKKELLVLWAVHLSLCEIMAKISQCCPLGFYLIEVSKKCPHDERIALLYSVQLFLLVYLWPDFGEFELGTFLLQALESLREEYSQR